MFSNQADFYLFLWETSCYLTVPLSSVFLCFSLVTVNWKTSYESGILRQYLGCITGWLINPILSIAGFFLIFRHRRRKRCVCVGGGGGGGAGGARGARPPQ